MVDVQQCPLGTLEHDIGAIASILVKDGGDIGHHGQQFSTEGQRPVQHLLHIQRLDLVVVLESEVVILHHIAQFACKA